MARSLSWLEHTVHTRSVEGSSPPLAIYKHRYNAVFFVHIFRLTQSDVEIKEEYHYDKSRNRRFIYVTDQRVGAVFSIEPDCRRMLCARIEVIYNKYNEMIYNIVKH